MPLGVLYATGLRGPSVPRSRHGLGISAGALRYLSDRRTPQTCVYGFILPRAFRLLQSATACDLPLVPRKTLRPSGSREAPPLGFAPLIATSTSGVHSCPGSHSRTDVPSSAFRTPSTVYSATSLAGLFHPAATSRVRPPGIYPSPRSRTGFPRPIALVPLSEGTCWKV